jgi:hypothetical protein
LFVLQTENKDSQLKIKIKIKILHGLGLRGRLGHLLLLFQRRVPPGQLLALAFLLKGTRMRQADLNW